MSLATQIASAIERAQFHELDALSLDLWKAYEAKQLTDEQAQGLAEQLEAKRPEFTTVVNVTSFKPAIAKPKPQRSPDKQASIERRRRLARQSPVPPEHVHEFSLSMHAALTIIVGEIAKHGVCSLCMDAIASLAGTCRTIVREAMKKGRALGLLTREERRRRGQKSLTNLVRILRPSWKHWLNWIGRRKLRSTKDKDPSLRDFGAAEQVRGRILRHAPALE
jgi:hypothetical protein